MIDSFLYVIAPKTGPVKIGISASPEVRLRTLQTGYPKKLSVIAAVPGGADDEEQVHKFLWGDRLEGEWFRRSKEVGDFINLINGGCPVPVAIARLTANRKKVFFEWSAEMRRLSAV